ncbi:MAG: hypothetical protein M0Q14_03565 [Tissierellaceae bacterium]|nr:hypothetical protein [Tissierellaceae bacterium]
MLIIIFNAMGLILIIFSLFVIAKDFKKDNEKSKDLNRIENDVKEYYKLTEEIVETFDQIIDNKLELINHGQTSNVGVVQKPQNEITYSEGDDNLELHNSENPDKEYINQIINLRSIGLTREEIARKLNKGIREVDIILKIYNNKNKS